MMEDLSVELEHATEGTVCIWRIYHYRKNNRHRNSLYIKIYQYSKNKGHRNSLYDIEINNSCSNNKITNDRMDDSLQTTALCARTYE